MDYRSGLEAVRAIQGAIDEGADREVFDAQMREIYGHAVETTGTLAVDNASGVESTKKSGEVLVTDPLEVRLAQYLDPEAELDVFTQLALVGDFWRTISSRPMPRLDSDQIDALDTALAEAAPGSRLVAVPLLDIYERVAVAEQVKKHPQATIDRDRTTLELPPEDLEYGELLRLPEMTVRYGRTSLGLRYKTPSGQLVTRSQFGAIMVEAGHAVKEGSVTWLFTVMNVQPSALRRSGLARDLYDQIDPSVIPDTLVAMQLMHQLAGVVKPSDRDEVDFANEAVYILDANGDPVGLFWVPGIKWDQQLGRIIQDIHGADDHSDSYGFRDARSGILKTAR